MRSFTAAKAATSAVLVLLLVCTCTTADSVKGAAPVYSSFECSSVEGADPTDVTARSCVLHNVCLERVDDGHATWSYFADPSKPQDVPLLDPSKDSGEIAAMGYRRGLHMHVDIVRDRSYRPRHIVDPARVTVAFCTPTNSYAHFVMDGMFGLHWLLTHYGYADETTGALTSRANIDILDVCRQSKQEKYLRGLFTDTTPSLGTRLSLFALSALEPIHSHTLLLPLHSTDYVGSCYANVVVGPAGHYTLHGFKTTDPIYSTTKDFDRFRNFLLVCSTTPFFPTTITHTDLSRMNIQPGRRCMTDTV